VVDLVVFLHQLDQMKVKTGDLKTNLSRYLREMRATGNPIEVCVREETVAYLTPASFDSEGQAAREELSSRLAAGGITVTRWGSKPTYQPKPGCPRDGRNTENSVLAMRREKDW